MADVTEHVNWFDHMFVRKDELKLDFDYLQDRRWRHSVAFHTPGIIDGDTMLTVAFDVGTNVATIAAGWAVDKKGREIILTTQKTVAVNADAGDLWIQFNDPTGRPSIDPGAGGKDTRVIEDPNIGFGNMPADAIKLGEIEKPAAQRQYTKNGRQVVSLWGDTILSQHIKEWDGVSPANDPNTGAGIKTAHLADDVVTSDKLADNAVLSQHIKEWDNTVATDANAGAGVKTDHLANLGVTTGKLADDAVTSQKLATWDDGSVVTNANAGHGVKTDHLANGAVLTDKLGDDAVTSQKLATWDDGSVVTNANAGHGVKTDHLANGAVVTSKLADDAVTSGKLAIYDGSAVADPNVGAGVKTDHLATGAVLTGKLADDAVTSPKLATWDGTPATNANAGSGVKTDHLADVAVTTAKIADDAVTEVKIVDDNVTQAKIANESVAFQELKKKGKSGKLFILPNNSRFVAIGNFREFVPGIESIVPASSLVSAAPACQRTATAALVRGVLFTNHSPHPVVINYTVFAIPQS